MARLGEVRQYGHPIVHSATTCALSLPHRPLQMLKERAAVEQSYTKELQKWADRWAKHFDKKPEFGSLGAGYQAFITEARQCANVHHTVSAYVELLPLPPLLSISYPSLHLTQTVLDKHGSQGSLGCAEETHEGKGAPTVIQHTLSHGLTHTSVPMQSPFIVVSLLFPSHTNRNLTALADTELPKFKKEQYHKDFPMGYKEVKAAEKGFTKAQKPYAKLHSAVVSNKKAYYAACNLRCGLRECVVCVGGVRRRQKEGAKTKIFQWMRAHTSGPE